MTLSAGDPPNVGRERGFNATSVYQFNNVDTVNLYNGNLNLAIPLGTYPVSADVSYSFVLRYSTNFWQYYYEKILNPGPNDPPPHQNWFILGDNIGVGWNLGFGSLEDMPTPLCEGCGMTWRYVGVDGSSHTFFPTLHDPICPDQSPNCDTLTPGVWYTRDGSYLRLRTVGTAKVLEFPDGQRHRFESSGRPSYFYGASSLPDANGIPTANYVKFEYPAPPSGSAPFIGMVVTDSHGRRHEVWYQHEQSYNLADRIDKIRLAAFRTAAQEAANTEVYADVDLVYDSVTEVDGEPVLVARPCSELTATETQLVRFLRRITLPGGELWKFAYDVSDTQHPDCVERGVMLQATLPTGGNINWSYQKYAMNTNGGAAATGVKERCLRTDSSPCSLQSFSGTPAQEQYQLYTREGPIAGITVNTNVDTYRISGSNWVRSARSVNYFDPDGLPLSSTVESGLNLSSQTFSCAGTCTLERTEYLRYEKDATFACVPNYPCQRERNPRVVASRTKYNSDGDRFTETSRENFDGLGHYRLTKTTGSADWASARETYTLFNPGVGTYALNSSGGRAPGFTMLSSSAPWILGTYTTTTTAAEGEASIFTQSCFNASTGFLERVRLLKDKSGNPGTSDLLRTYHADASGYPDREESFGGDYQSVDLNTCTATPPAHTQYSYRIDHTYQYGVLKTSQYSGMPWLAVNNSQIDRNTGLIRESKDVAGIQTSYEYDSRGRLKKVEPAGNLSPTTYTYVPASASAAAQVQARTESSGTDVLRVEQKWEFDPFGRISIEKQLQPSPVTVPGESKWGVRKTTYTSLGQRATVSEWENEVGATYGTVTTFSDYDVFGRVGKITSPDASQASFTYGGTRTMSRTQTGGGMQPLTITASETYDAYGRLTAVQENSGPAGELVTTTYGYDAANRLTTVKMLDHQQKAQFRFFAYDGRGLLQWESQPESGMKAYTYDARGHVITADLGEAKTMFDLRFTYDSAERLKKVEARRPDNPNSYRPFKEFVYGTDNDPSSNDYRLGRLVTATRYNYNPNPGSGFPIDTVRVSETYRYGDATGRKTDRTTTIATTRSSDLVNGPWYEARSILQSIGHDPLGMPYIAIYPMCVGCGTPPTNPWRDLTATYSHGRPVKLVDRVGDLTTKDVVRSITYWPNGMRRVLQHENLIEDTQVPDSSGMARPGVLKSETYKPCRAPEVTSQTLGLVRKTTDGPVLLQVTATGSAPLSYRWYKSTNGSEVLIGTGASSIEVSPNSTETYFAEITNDCRTVRSSTITVKYGNCVAPWITRKSATRNANGTFTLSVDAAGTETLSYTWKRTSDNAVVGTTAVVTTGVLTAHTDYTVTVKNACDETGISDTVTAAVPVTIASMTVTADRDPAVSNQINISWNSVAGASSYSLERRSGTQWESVCCNSLVTQYQDAGVPPDIAYAYRITASNSTGQLVGQSAADVVTTLTFTPVSSGGWVAAAPLEKLLQAVNAVRSLSGWTTVAWSNILGPNEPLPSPGTIVLGRHLLAIRARLNEAMQAVGVPMTAFTNADLKGLPVRAVHINEIQERLK